MDEKIIKILLDRIQSGKISPVTNEPFKLEDIKLEDYRAEVERRLLASNL
jgi:hypothetical protein